MNQTVQFVRTKEFPVIPEYRWWNRFRWWLVKLLGGENPYETVKVERVTFNTEDFMEKLFVQQEELVKSFNRHPKELLIGADDFERLMCTKTVTDMFAFNASYNHGPKVCGLKVKVIPWMRGMVIMP